MPADSTISQRMAKLEQRVSALEKKAPYRGAVIQPSGGHYWKKAFLICLGIWLSSKVLSLYGLFGKIPYQLFYSIVILGYVSFMGGIISLIMWAIGTTRAQPSPNPRRTKTNPLSTIKVSAISAAPAAKPSRKLQAEPSFEAQIGTRWAGWTGIVALVLGVAYFVTYAITNEWIGPIGQIIIGCLAGIGLVFTGRLLEQKQGSNAFTHILEGGGFALLYFSVYAAYGVYPAQTGIGPYVDMALLVLVCACAVFFAITTQSKTLAIEAFALGYGAPLVTSDITLFTVYYALLLSCAFCYILYRQAWDSYVLLAAGGSYLVHLYWINQNPSSVLHNSILLLGYLSLYTAYGYFATRRKPALEDESISAPAWVFIIFTLLIAIMAERTIGFVILIPLLGCFFLAIRKTFSISYLDYFTFFAVYALQYIWLSDNMVYSTFWPNALITSSYLLAGLAYPLFIEEKRSRSERIIFDFINAAGYFGIMYWAVSRYFDFATGLFTLGLAGIFFLSSYINFTRDEEELSDSRLALGLALLSIAIPLQLHQQWITLAWMVEALILAILGIRRKDPTVNLIGHAVAIGGVIRLLIYDGSLSRFTLANPLGATRLWVFALSILCLYYSWVKLSTSAKGNGTPINAYWINAYWYGATLLSSYLLYIEINESMLSPMAQSLGTTIAWAIQASIITGVGFWKNIRTMRLTGLGILAICILKAFILDLAGLEQPYRFISFIILGIILLAVSYLYTKKRYLVEKIL